MLPAKTMPSPAALPVRSRVRLLIAVWWVSRREVMGPFPSVPCRPDDPSG